MAETDSREVDGTSLFRVCQKRLFLVLWRVGGRGSL